MSTNQVVPELYSTIIPPARVTSEPGPTVQIQNGMKPNAIVSAYATVGEITHDVIPPPSPIT